jgi:hypothetical protein
MLILHDLMIGVPITIVNNVNSHGKHSEVYVW